jgi:microcystin degradation protein MlrC
MPMGRSYRGPPCFDADEAASFPLRFGGKISPASGMPIDGMATVTALKRPCWRSFGRPSMPFGDWAAIRVGGIPIVLISNRTQAPGRELLGDLGIEPTERKPRLVTSTNHFMAAFGPIAAKVIDLDPDGPLIRDYRKIPYTGVRRPIWPLEAEASPGLIA